MNSTQGQLKVDMSGWLTSNEGLQDKPRDFELKQNYPNPFNPSTNIQYALPMDAHVSLVVFNALGQKVMELVNGQKSAGYHTVELNANGLSSGIYFYT
ncbi:MAG: T9SS C-terminal target domain-containing protein, partial [Proteobacteria bacterium]|nr:T9SS C-terminal target domain-containing protein [Pseudomonadota bacterium]